MKEDDIANVVKRIFRDYLDGIGMETIAKNSYKRKGAYTS